MITSKLIKLKFAPPQIYWKAITSTQRTITEQDTF